MKTQLSCFALIALISLISTAFITLDKENGIINIDKYSFYETGSLESFLENHVQEELKKHESFEFNTIDFSKCFIGQVRYWSFINAIKEFIEKNNIKSVSVIFSDKLKDNIPENIQAEVLIVSEEIPNVQTNFDLEKLKNPTYETYIQMHNTEFTEHLTIELPSFEGEYECLNFPDNLDCIIPPIVSSNYLYNYVFAGVDWSEVESITLFHPTLYNYLKGLKLPKLTTLIFDFSLLGNDAYISITSYVQAIFNNNPDNRLHVILDLNGLANIFEDEAELDKLEKTYRTFTFEINSLE